MMITEVQLKHLLQAAYSAGVLDAAGFAEQGITAGELRRFAEGLAESYAVRATRGQMTAKDDL